MEIRFHPGNVHIQLIALYQPENTSLENKKYSEFENKSCIRIHINQQIINTSPVVFG
jgi:hypothetical protein